jgi:hypothetical protein
MRGITGSPRDKIALCIKDLLLYPDRADPSLQGHRMPAQASEEGRMVGHFEFPELAECGTVGYRCVSTQDDRSCLWIGCLNNQAPNRFQR